MFRLLSTLITPPTVVEPHFGTCSQLVHSDRIFNSSGYPVEDEYVGVGTPVNSAWFYLSQSLFRQPEIDKSDVKTSFKELS